MLDQGVSRRRWGTVTGVALVLAAMVLSGGIEGEYGAIIAVGIAFGVGLLISQAVGKKFRGGFLKAFLVTLLLIVVLGVALAIIIPAMA